MQFFARLRSRKKKGGSRLFRYGWKVTLVILLAGAGFAVFLFYGTWASTFDMKNVGEMPERNTVYDVDGRIYSRLAGANRLKVSLSEVSPFFITAVLAREDSRFYDHKGIDWRGIMRALVRDITSASAKEGASSITQQLARNSLPLGGRTLSRKLLEAMVALRIERQFTKQQILELYVNRIYFGNGCYGVETASQAYFGKSASKLNLPEAALLAGLIRSPNRLSPLKNPEGAKIQRNAVLDRMVAIKKVLPADAEAAKQAKVAVHPRRMPFVQENYAMDAVQRDLNLLLTQDQIDDGGMSIYTTLDPAVQNAAQDALEAQLAKIEHQSNFHHPVKAIYHPPENGEGDSAMPYLEGAVVVIDNASGGIRALVGGRDYAQSKFNRALAPANRQVGSAFKPFVYTVAFTHGLLPGAAISDGPIRVGEIDGAGSWSPGNSDGTYGGILPCSYGLIHSRNTMSVRVGQFGGLDPVQKVANTLGISQNVPHGPAIYIGSFETDLKDLTAAYSVFPREPQANLSRRAYHGAGARSKRGLDDLAIDGRCLDTRDCCQLAFPGVPTSCSRQNGYDERLQRCVVSRLHQYSDLRCVGWIRSADDNYFPRLRCRASAPGLDASNEQGGATLSGRAVATDDADPTRHGLFTLESTRHHGMYVRRDSV
ncbi:MAG: hypothetical protein DME55_01825 [Verrucomicrobia bacterium]|nr:MAG: hypothetical protein DME55_01825 [Verrucomicrobiota bacterium]